MMNRPEPRAQEMKSVLDAWLESFLTAADPHCDTKASDFFLAVPRLGQALFHNVAARQNP